MFQPTRSAARPGALVTLCMLGAGCSGGSVLHAPAGDGRLLGVVAGLSLAAFTAYALLTYLKPLRREPGVLFHALVVLAAIGLLEFALLPLFPGLGIDVGSYRAWAARLVDVGPANAYQPGYFLDYPPGYLYALWAAGALARALELGGTAERVMIESPAIIAGLVLALVVFAMVWRSGRRLPAYVAMLVVALNPALLFDALVWGQSDSVPALLMTLSVALALESEYELCWGLAALAVLVKPQALLLLPVLGGWALLKGKLADWARAAMAFAAIAVIAIGPFQIGRPWNWIFTLYGSTLSYYHETSVNAFNLMALLGGLRQSDTTVVLGFSIYALGMGMLAALYCFIGYLLWRQATRRTLILAAFLALFGSFMVAARMHERYLYPALIFIVPLAVDRAEPWSDLLIGVLAATSAAFLFNLATVKQALEAGVFLTPHPAGATIASLVNLLALIAAAIAACATGRAAALPGASALWSARLLIRLREALAERPAPAERLATIPWLRIDTLAISALTAAGALTRLWRIWLPAEIVFDEVHFVGQARHYLHGEPFLDPHPPLAKLLIAASIDLFGDHSWSWRLPNALIGTALVAITYLLGRRMFASRLAATLAAAFVLCDGMFLVDSRIAVLDIVYVTFAAWSYLMLFRFAQTADLFARRRTLLALGLVLGLCLASKLYIPVVAVLLVAGFVVFIVAREATAGQAGGQHKPVAVRLLEYRIGGALALVGGASAMVYLAVFLPHFWLGWWGGIGDLARYYGQVIWYEQSVAAATHPYSAPWWSWPLMLRPIAYWQNFPPAGKVATIWGGGNPALWWGALSAVALTAVQALEHKGLVRTFLLAGYLAYLAIWLPIGRTLFLYHYMPAVYLGFLALAAILAQCWEGRAQLFEHAALMLTLMPVFVLGLGPSLGAAACLAVTAVYVALLLKTEHAGRWVCAVFVGAALVLFLYFLPVWVGYPIERSAYYARMWLKGPGLRNWI